MGVIEDLTNWEMGVLESLLREHLAGPLEKIAAALEASHKTLERRAGAVGFMIGSLVNETDAELRIGREPNGDFYVVLEIGSRVPSGRQGFWEEHATSVSGLIVAIRRVSEAYHDELAANGLTGEPF